MNRRPPFRRTGKLANYILQRLWWMKLGASGFDDIEYGDGELRPDDSRIFAELHPVEAAERAEFYQRMGAGADDLTGADKQIALMVSEGKDVRTIKAELKVGQCRIERVIHSILGERKPPWYRRPETRAKRRAKSRQTTQPETLTSQSG